MEQLKRWREARGLSQTKLAARADVNPATVNQIEGGKRTASPATLHKLADALDVSLYELLEGEPSPKASRRSSPEPPLRGIKGERREYDFEAARDGLDRFCAYWEQRLADGNISRQEFDDVGVTAETWIPILEVAALAEQNEIIESGRRNPSPTVYGTGSELLSLSEIWKAADRFIKLGSRLAQAEHDKYADAEAETRRAQFRRLEGMRDIA